MKKPSFEKIKSLCRDIDDDLIKKHLARLGMEYFNYFPEDEVCLHLNAVSKLSIKENVEVICSADPANQKKISCVVIGYDYPSVFSLITGILSSFGFQIISGKIFTYYREAENKTSRELKISRKNLKFSIKKRVIIDCFNGILPGAYSKIWLSDIKSALVEVFALLGMEDEESMKKAREKVNEQVALRISGIRDTRTVFYPVIIEFDKSNKSYTLLKVFSQDTPYFLYALSTALSLENILIEYVNITTVNHQIMDEFGITDTFGKKIENNSVLDRIKYSVLLTKQFTYFIGNSPDPYTALSRFEFLTHEFLSLPERENWKDILLDPPFMKDLARLLGASDFMWEDFIRSQYETIFPLLKEAVDTGKLREHAAGMISERLSIALEKAGNREEERDILNDFKDKEIFQIDLENILNPGKGIRMLSEHLTALADCIVDTAANLSYNYLAGVYGHPLTVAGLRAKYSILGLGKFGGAALGYASDIEVLFVYSDSGKTDGINRIDNSIFFDLLVKDVLATIKAKKEGIFDLDLRLRPYGSKGPLASSLDLFCKYYGPGGDAHSYERLALVRMRPVGGDREFGSQLKRIRNEFIYFTESISIRELNDIRKKQLIEKTKSGKINAKFSSGALVDIEYTVQLLQVIYGKDYPALRTSKIHSALTAFARAGILNSEESDQIIKAYDFFRLLINGLRMLRGSAKDLFLPDADSIEFTHLARRMGYREDRSIGSAQKLHIDFETRSAMVRAFIENHFGEDMMPGEKTGNIADIIISNDLTESFKQKILSGYGFRNPERAYINFKKLSDDKNTRDIFTGLAVLATDTLMHKSDPDTALNNWERFVNTVERGVHYREMLSQPKKLDILLNIFSSSQYLSDALIKNPDFLEWVVNPRNLYKSLNRKEIESELRELFAASDSYGDWLNRIRVLKKREILRIGTRDICLAMPLSDIVNDLSILAESFIEVSAEKNNSLIQAEKGNETHDFKSKNYTILAFGKLGGNELNYSSDVDLMLLYAGEKDNDSEQKEIYSRLMEGVSSDLSSHTEENYAYRVDLRLRPWGSAGSLAYNIADALQYYNEAASIWEIQALLKLRPVTGNIRTGKDFIRVLYDICVKRLACVNIPESVEKLRAKSIKEKTKNGFPGIDIKNGIGGIRDIEFMVQGLQLANLSSHPELFEGNTLKAMTILAEMKIIGLKTSEELKNDYIFMRRLEHFLQLYEDRQVHTLPKDPSQVEAISKRMLGLSATSNQLMNLIQKCQERIRVAYNKYLLGL